MPVWRDMIVGEEREIILYRFFGRPDMAQDLCEPVLEALIEKTIGFIDDLDVSLHV